MNPPNAPARQAGKTLPYSAKTTLLFLVGILLALDCAAEPNASDKARQWISALAQVFENSEWSGAAAAAPRLVAQAPGQIYNAGLAPVWATEVTTPSGAKGHLMWEDAPEARLVEFALERVTAPVKSAGDWLPSIPNLQQFPVPGQSAPQVASGCVPTAAANLIGFWATRGFPNWLAGAASHEVATLRQATKRLRTKLAMQEIQDKDGFTDNGMPVSGAYPQDLMQALKQDAAELGIDLEANLARFSMEALKRETTAKRPVLISCVVRLPQKPHLSWGHEVTGIGWLELAGRSFVGVRDNFLPSGTEETTRWLEAGQCQILLTVRPNNATFKPQ